MKGRESKSTIKRCTDTGINTRVPTWSFTHDTGISVPGALCCTLSILQWQSSTSNQSHLEKWERKQHKYKSITQFRAKSLQERENLSRSEHLKAEGMVNIRTYNLMTQLYRTNHSAAEKACCSHFSAFPTIWQELSNPTVTGFYLQSWKNTQSRFLQLGFSWQQGCGFQWESLWPGKAARAILNQSGLIWRDGNPSFGGETALAAQLPI